FAESGLDDTGAAATNCAGVGQTDVASCASRILVHSNQSRHTTTLAICASNGVAGSLGRHHDDVHVVTRLNLAVVHVEAMSECQGGTGFQIVVHLITVDFGDVLVRQQNHRDISRL